MEDLDETVLKKQKKDLERMAEERRQLFQSLEISESDFLKALKDRKNFSPETWEVLQKRRHELEEVLDKKIQAASTPKEPKKPHSPPQIGGHWIHVK